MTGTGGPRVDQECTGTVGQTEKQDAFTRLQGERNSLVNRSSLKSGEVWSSDPTVISTHVSPSLTLSRSRIVSGSAPFLSGPSKTTPRA